MSEFKVGDRVIAMSVDILEDEINELQQQVRELQLKILDYQNRYDGALDEIKNLNAKCKVASSGKSEMAVTLDEIRFIAADLKTLTWKVLNEGNDV